ncbi:MAG: hypothetical protein RE471_06045 [Ferroplasma sp.]|uniref:McrC family protein n=1 Tax=Ferroplasma sp. TaxID=2591003 RepID=UPI002815823C|nr:hypothetical protein [Ferroplasma sp.]WMT50542.1 MAG: hypothetical protein RE471_06045 [Ferroplasma sp.]
MGSSNLKTLYEYEPCMDNDIIHELNELTSRNEELSKFMEITKTYVKFKHYTGFIPTKNYRIQVLPKIRNLDLDEKNSSNNLIRILLYVFSPPGASIPKVEIKDNTELDILDLIIRMYAITLGEQILQGAYRKYIRLSEESKFLKGKLNIAKQISRMDQSKFSVIDFRFSMDNDLNRFFAHANRYFMQFTHDRANANLLAWIDSILHDEDISPWHQCKISFNRLNERFRIPYIYASLILQNKLMLSGESYNTMAMIFDMNKIFERFFTEFICRNKREIFGNEILHIRVQEGDYNFIYDNNAIRYTKPDLILFLKDSTCIFDTKYKKLDEPKICELKKKNDKVHSIAPSDLYQMYAYSQIYHSKNTILVFPGAESKLSKSYRFTENGNKKLWVYMLKLNLNNNWESDLVQNFKHDFTEIQNQDH